MKVIIRRWLKVTDPTALTATEALRRALSYGRDVQGLYRSELFVLELPEDVSANQAREAIEHFAEGSNLLYNPNKHAKEVVFGSEIFHPRGNAWILAWEDRDESSLLQAINRGSLPFQVLGVRTAMLWELDWSGENPRSVAEDLAVSRERKKGLLVNPHFQQAAVLAEKPHADTLAGLLASRSKGTHEYA